MAFQWSHFNNAMRGGACENGNYWWPSYNNWEHIVKTRISNTYMTYLGRYAEPGGLAGWFSGFVSQYPDIAANPWTMPTTTHLNASIIAGAQASGEWGYFHNWLGAGSCPPPPVYGCTNPTAANYNPSADTDNGSCWWYNASVNIWTSNTNITVGQSATISWSSSNAQSVSVSGYGLNSNSLNNYSGQSVSPSSTTTYYITGWAYGNGASGNDGVIINVYIPPNVTLTSNTVNDTIIRGQSFTLTWNTTGDADTANLSPGFGNVPVNSNQPNVSPTSTTTYTISVSGPGGNDSDDLMITVLQPPSVDLWVPPEVEYGSSFTVDYSGENISSSLTLTTDYGSSVTLPTGSSVSGSHTFTDVPWDNTGPTYINMTLDAVGAGGLTASDGPKSISVNIDTTPDLIAIPNSEDKMKDEDPVISPDSEVTTTTIEIKDIDIPVEIKSNVPVQVEIDDDDNWQDVRQI